MKLSTSNRGFTLIELLVVIGVIAILAAIVLVAVNPGRQFAQARDTQRRSDLYSLTNAIYQFAAEHEGNLPSTAAENNFPTGTDGVCIGNAAPCFNLGAAGNFVGGTITEAIVPTYIAEIPTDPTTGTEANTQYYLLEDADGRVVATAAGELVTEIKVTR